MSPSPLVRFFVESLDVGGELLAVDSPDASPADLDCRQFTRADQRVDLRNADVQVRRYVLERQKARLDSGRLPFLRRLVGISHGSTVAILDGLFSGLFAFTAV